MCAILALILGPVFVASIPSQANACSFSIQRSIAFDSGVSSISNRDRVDLAKTVIDANNSVARTGSVVIYGITEEGAKGGKAITQKRVESVMAYLQALGISESRFNVDYQALGFASDTPASERYQVLVEFIPASSPCA